MQAAPSRTWFSPSYCLLARLPSMVTVVEEIAYKLGALAYASLSHPGALPCRPAAKDGLGAAQSSGHVTSRHLASDGWLCPSSCLGCHAPVFLHPSANSVPFAFRLPRGPHTLMLTCRVLNFCSTRSAHPGLLALRLQQGAPFAPLLYTRMLTEEIFNKYNTYLFLHKLLLPTSSLCSVRPFHMGGQARNLYRSLDLLPLSSICHLSSSPLSSFSPPRFLVLRLVSFSLFSLRSHLHITPCSLLVRHF